MKTYTIKNYKGNLVESLKKFQEKYPNVKICEASEDIPSVLKIVGEEKEPIEEASRLLIVVNSYYGGFSIPKKFTSETGVENNGYAIANPMAPNVKCAGYEYRTKGEPDGDDGDLETRCDPRFVEWVSNNSRVAKTLDIVAVPANATDIMINEYDGSETVLYVKDGHISYGEIQ